MYRAVVLGATGLVGKHLVNALINDPECEEIRVIVRRKTNFSHQKIHEYIIHFSKTEDYLKHIKGDVLFSCLGTTRGQAKSIKKHYLVDYIYQLTAAKSAIANGIKNYILISSPWANLKSGNYYRKMKAELERDTKNLPFEKITILQPNGLKGEREKSRFGEKWGIPLFITLTKIFPSLRKHKPIEAEKVAQVMLKAFHLSLLRPNKTLLLERDKVESY